MKTKRCVAAALFMMILIAVVGCGKKQNHAKSQFIKDFDLNISKKDCEFEELFNNYEGFPYEGIEEYTNVSFCVYDADKEIAYLITMDS